MIDHTPSTLAERADATEHRETRVFGPPGTGKTAWIARQVRRAVEHFGESSVLCTSFSKTAAQELAGRDLPIDKSRIGTLHAHCYRALGTPRIAEAHVEGWNKLYGDTLRLSGVDGGGEAKRLDGEMSSSDDAGGPTPGDAYLEELSRLRGMERPRSVWPANLLRFEELWSAYKKSNGLMDFTDLIETAREEIPVAPGDPRVLFADEAQDLNKMQLGLIRKWGNRAAYFIVAADDDQTLYSFAGCEPDAVLSPPLPPENVIMLKQSHRIPAAVHAKAVSWIERVSHRQPKEYLPREEEGFFRRAMGTWRSPNIELIEAALNECSKIQDSKGAMVLTSCTYMLAPLMAELRRRGIPFHNPYRPSSPWNPLRQKASGSAPNRVWALLHAHPRMSAPRQWNFHDLRLWTEWLASEGVMKRGAKKRIEQTEKTQEVTIADLDSLFEPAALDSLLATFEGDHRAMLAWWVDRMTKTGADKSRFAATIASRNPEALIQEPQLVIGTIHSVKGCEADVVILFPDLSVKGAISYETYGLERDSVIRQFYVGMTRARRGVYVCEPCGAAVEGL